MKIEDIKISIPKHRLSEQSEIEEWRNETPMDYFKAVAILNKATSPIASVEVFKAIYQIIRLYIPDVLYKFISLSEDEKGNDQKFETLLRKKMYLSTIDKFNDPFDSKAFFYYPEVLEKYKRIRTGNRGKLIDDITKYIRTASLTENNVFSLPMWAHYANNHKGFCIAYNMKKNTVLAGCTFPVQYTEERLDISSFIDDYMGMVVDKIEEQQNQGRKQIMIDDNRFLFYFLLLCNIKHSSWNYEKEFRCTEASNAPGAPYIDAIPSEIYIGMKCSLENETQLRKIGKQLNIPVHKMIWDDYSENFKLSMDI